jgi:hypothetical protein
MPPLKTSALRIVGIFFQFSLFFHFQRLGTELALISFAVKRSMDWITTNKSL